MPEQSKPDLINERKAGLDLPDTPPVASDWNSLDARNVNVGAGRQRRAEMPKEAMSGNDPHSTAGLREPASEGSGVRDAAGINMSGLGRQGEEHL
ncbi:Uncharacterized protein BP5553_03562 [Venustampulla echinocandica]|uniref:Uncharacterized protein n=1 Tax=Venustampulla echinocandica TaxID=2656787 RepID=A0A370TUK4_9HELO|nr:Uncharacterized protein BP5553_03562 [Venustampulla echinocandica]RDL39222.1 Uncharacterized protein BP5553_03562 [Venustampulla echinocandica]